MLVLPLTLSKMGTIQTSHSHVKKLASPKFYLALGTWKLLLRLFSQPNWLPSFSEDEVPLTLESPHIHVQIQWQIQTFR